MDIQFTDLSVPDLNVYYCSGNLKSRGFTHLMKLVMMTKTDPDAIAIINTIIKNNPEEIDKKNENGYTALMLTSVQGCTNVVKILLNAGANVNLKNCCGATALILACVNSNTTSNVETVQLLLEAGANVNQCAIGGYTSLMLACRFSNLYSNVETVKLLLQHGANVNLQKNRGKTALMMACKYIDVNSNPETVKLLLESDADVSLQSRGGATALMWLLCNKNVHKYEEIVTHLTLKTAKNGYILLKTSNNKTAYDIYVEKQLNFFDENMLKILQGCAVINTTKSARCI